MANPSLSYTWSATGPDQPRSCCVCGERIIITREAVDFHEGPDTKWTRHALCRPYRVEVHVVRLA